MDVITDYVDAGLTEFIKKVITAVRHLITQRLVSDCLAEL